jgi:hypothetical protein
MVEKFEEILSEPICFVVPRLNHYRYSVVVVRSADDFYVGDGRRSEPRNRPVNTGE